MTATFSRHLESGGELVQIECELPWVAELLDEAAPGELRAGGAETPSVGITVEPDRDAFPTPAWEVLTRGAWHRDGEVVVENLCSSGFDVHVRASQERADFTFRWRPSGRPRAINLLLRSRFHLLARAALVQYPVLWRATVAGRAPLHASAWTVGDRSLMIAGPGGVGKSTLLAQQSNALAASDNVCVGDGTTLWGLVEPLRLEHARGRRMPHGRSETPMLGRLRSLVPDVLVVLRRGLDRGAARIRAVDADAATRSLVGGTYMAGELRRFWAVAATFSEGTGLGPPHPATVETAAAFAERLPRVEVRLGDGGATDMEQLLDSLEVGAWA